MISCSRSSIHAGTQLCEVQDCHSDRTSRLPSSKLFSSPLGALNRCTDDMGSSLATHVIGIKTRMTKGTSLGGNVFVKLGDEEGKWSTEMRINNTLGDDSQKGSIDSFHLNLSNLKKKITELGIRRDSTGVNDDWYLEKVIVKSIATGEKSYFPVNRWIHANDWLRLSEHDYSLPLQDKYADQRRAELEKKQQLYMLVTNQPGTPKAARTPIPHDEDFNMKYMIFLGSTMMQLGMQEQLENWFTSSFNSLDDFANIYYFAKIPAPEGIFTWKSDESFGDLRLAGVNPHIIQLCQDIPARFAVTSKMVEPLLEGKTLEDAMAQKKIYIEDLSFLESIPCVGGRKLGSPFGLFYVTDLGDFVPIAIQIKANPAEDNPVFLPTDPEYTWLMAKMWMNMADASLQQSFSHIGLHLFMESVAVCANRQLSPSHPVFKLLAPHLLYLIAINYFGITQMTIPGGWMDQATQMGRDGMFEIIRRVWSTWNLKENGNLLNDLKNRGVDDEAALPNYHYRDDAKLLWNAISDYVAEIVDQVYDNKEKLLNDDEIQKFAAELSSPEGAHIKGIPTRFTNTADLKETITVIIYTISVQHAAVSFGQYEQYGFIPNYPVSIETERPKTKVALSKEDVVAALPTKDIALSVIKVTKSLSSKATNSLGYSEFDYTSDPISKGALKRFRENLRVVAKTIDERNKCRENSYTYLHPDLVSNTIST